LIESHLMPFLTKSLEKLFHVIILMIQFNSFNGSDDIFISWLADYYFQQRHASR